jgi:hypothetical protein
MALLTLCSYRQKTLKIIWPIERENGFKVLFTWPNILPGLMARLYITVYKSQMRRKSPMD